VTDDFIGRLIGDERFGRFFAGHSTDSTKRIRQLIVDQLCEATGGPCVYIGRDMKTTHEGLGITEEDWNAAVAHLTASLDKFQVPQRETSCWERSGPSRATSSRAEGQSQLSL
jgi:hemoglobin